MNTTTTSIERTAALFGLLCIIAGAMCFAQGFSNGPAGPAVSQSTGERLGVSPPSALIRDAGTVQFTSLTPRYSTKRIADIEIGEDVVSRDPQSGEVTTKRVANVFRRVSDHLRILKVRNPETDELQTIETTNEHPFWVTARRDWIKAKDLNIGDHLDDVDGGQAILESTEFESHPDGIPVFNFEVEDFHNYYVRAHGSRGPPVLVHNADGYDILQTQILNATPPGINGLPGTGRFGYHVPPQINVDTGTAVAFVSEASSIRHSLKSHVAGKQMVMSQKAVNELQVNLRSAGPLEKARADRFMNRVQVIQDTPSLRASGLRTTGSVGANDKIIFGTGDYFGITTMTNDAKFLRGAKEQGVVFRSFLHPPVPFKGL